jgi:hypothetical protein
VPIMVFDGLWSDVFSHLNNPGGTRNKRLLPFLSQQSTHY